MNRKAAQTAAHAVIDHLAALERPTGVIENPDAWRRVVRNRIRSERWDTLTAALGDSHADAVQALITLIAGAAPPKAQASMAGAQSGEWARNERRARGLPPLCAKCDDGGVWFDLSNAGHECECKLSDSGDDT